MKIKLLSLVAILSCVQPIVAQRFMEKMDRGVVAIAQSPNSVFISWRLLTSDKETITFDVFRKEATDEPVKLNAEPIALHTWFLDTSATSTNSVVYYVTEHTKQEFTKGNSYELTAGQQGKPYLSIPIQQPADGEVGGRSYSYSANDASVGDLDGDGEYEILLKWQPRFTRNPPQTGLTGNHIIDAYKMDGTLLWRINLGVNIRAGAAYTQFLVYDLDMDGKAEILFKTADGTIDGQGNAIGDKNKDWRVLDPESPIFGKVLEGPEYLTVFEGLTGKALTTVDFIPDRFPLDGWGGNGGNGNNDNSGGRADRFLGGVAYFDGKTPSAFFVRGLYGRTVVTAWDYSEGKLSTRWVFDSENRENPYSGQGNHQLTVADFDRDGKDEICVGSMVVDDNGKGLYSTGLRHGDALHVSDLDPDNEGLEVYGIHENEGKTVEFGTPGVAIYDGATGKILFGIGPGVDVGRGVAADIDPTYRGFENWGGPGGLRDAKGNTISEKTPSSVNFVVWWDGDLTRELLDKNRIDKWDWENNTTHNLLTANECWSNNGTKATPCLSADIFGDWREEVIWRTRDNAELRIYSTTLPTNYRFTTFMQDPQYRLSIVWQNAEYNQPPHTSFNLVERETRK